jgi:predicted aspartyl protease
MGIFTAKLRVWNPAGSSAAEEFEVMVDTGASYSWVLRSRLEHLGVRPVRKMQFRTIEGHTIERELAPVFVATDGFTGGDNVVMAESGDMEVMGAHTLESLGITVDPVAKKLVPAIGLALTAIPVEVPSKGTVRDMRTAYLAQPTGPSFPSVGHGEPRIAFERSCSYFIVSKDAAEAERLQVSSQFSEYDWTVERVEQSSGAGFIVVGRPRTENS